MKWNEFIKELQGVMNMFGSNLKIDGDPGPLTKAELEKYEVTKITLVKKPQPPAPPIEAPPIAHVENPAYQLAKKDAGKGESNSKFVAWLSSFWPKVNLGFIKTIIGASAAWCALTIAAYNSEVGQSYIKSGSAMEQGQNGNEINFKAMGLPRGAQVWINHDANCKSASSNHITWADGDCSVEDVNKAGAQFPGYGGNQANMMKRSMYPVAHICRAAWPKELPMPGKITKSVGCSGVDQGKESTQ